MVQWLKDAVFYEIYPNSFMDSNGDGYGDFKGITQKIPYIKSLGCNAVWLNPHYKSDFFDGGYDVVDYFKCSERFGTEADFDAMLETFHANGIKLILDLVPGHTSENNADFLKSAENVPNDMYDRFVWTKGEWEFPEGYRFISGRHNRFGNYMVNFFSTQPALNYGFKEITHPEWQLPYTHPECMKTREWLKSVMRFWLKRGADGFRVDMADSLVKNDDDKSATSEIWRDISDMVKREFPNAVLISEWSSPRAVHAGFDVDFMLDHHGNAYNTLVRYEEAGKTSYFNPNGAGNAEEFADKFANWLKENENLGYIGIITCNHDTPRLAPFYDEDSLKIIQATLMMLPGVPFVYYGDEIGIKYVKGMPSVECGFARTGTRTPMQWNSKKNAGFSTADKTFLPVPDDCKPNVEEEEKDGNSLLNTLRRTIALRHEYASQITSFDFEILHAKGSEPLAFRRGVLTVFVNPLKKPQTIKRFQVGELLYNIGDAPSVTSEITLAPLSFAVFKAQ